MINKIILMILAFSSAIVNSQNIIGAWEMSTTSKQGVLIKNVVIFTEGYQVISRYESETGNFIGCNGGTWKLNDGIMTEKVEFDTQTPERIGNEVRFEIAITDTTLNIVGANKRIFKRIDNGTPGKLQGAWLMSGKMRDGRVQSRDINRPRKTMKILSGSRFQWIAYNTETKQFMGTGGGTYNTYNGKYTENIEFFSRDNSKVGASLEFNFTMNHGKWHHQGLSSKGNAIYEIWTIRP
jgi:hypothetical protein